jgi:hypothetical protein
MVHILSLSRSNRPFFTKKIRSSCNFQKICVLSQISKVISDSVCLFLTFLDISHDFGLYVLHLGILVRLFNFINFIVFCFAFVHLGIHIGYFDAN